VYNTLDFNSYLWLGLAEDGDRYYISYNIFEPVFITKKLYGKLKATVSSDYRKAQEFE
jgi:hypothetical protein